MHGRSVAVLVAALAALLFGCDGGDGGEVAGGTSTSTAPPSTTATTTSTPTVEPAATAWVDWGTRTADVFAPGFEVVFCEGDAPLLCVEHGGRFAGTVEHVSFPVESIDALAEGLQDGDELAALEAFAAEYVASFAADRADGCDAGYEVVGEPVAGVPVAGGTGIRYGFTGAVDGEVVERNLGYATVRDGHLHLITAAGLADDGCLAREGELGLDQLDAFAPHLAAVAAGSVLPTA